MGIYFQVHVSFSVLSLVGTYSIVNLATQVDSLVIMCSVCAIDEFYEKQYLCNNAVFVSIRMTTWIVLAKFSIFNIFNTFFAVNCSTSSDWD